MQVFIDEFDICFGVYYVSNLFYRQTAVMFLTIYITLRAFTSENLLKESQNYIFFIFFSSKINLYASMNSQPTYVISQKKEFQQILFMKISEILFLFLFLMILFHLYASMILKEK